MILIKRLPLLAAAGVGYVLGARAGRQRYEQIASTAKKVADDPRVQRVASKAQGAAKEKVTAAASTAADKVRGRDGDDGLDGTAGYSTPPSSSYGTHTTP